MEKKDVEESFTDDYMSDRFKNFGENTAIHGIRNVTKGNKFTRRVFWVLVLCTSLCILTYQVCTFVMEFMNFETNTKFQKSYKGSLPFPNITICNLNMFRNTMMMEEFGSPVAYYGVGIWYLKSLFPSVSFLNTQESVLPFEDEFPRGGDVKSFIERNAHEINTMVRVCHFNGQSCSAENFKTTMTNYGLCYTFVPPDDGLIDDTGISYGLSLILYVEECEYFSAPRENIGFRIAVTDQHKIPNLEADGIDISPGKETHIAIRKSKVVTLPHPYGNCVEEGTRKLSYFDQPYTQNKCLIECESKFVANKCSCRTYYLPGDGSVPFCSPKQLVNCFNPIKSEFISKRTDICDCPEECIKDDYWTSMSFSLYPSTGIVSLLQSLSYQPNITAAALGYFIMLHSEYDLYQNPENGVKMYTDAFNMLSLFLVEIEPERLEYLYILYDACSDLLETIANIVTNTKILVAVQLNYIIYFDFESNDPQFNINSTYYFDTKALMYYYIKAGLYEDTKSKLDQCIDTLFPDGQYNYSELFEEFYARFVEETYEEEYKVIYELYLHKLKILITENSKEMLTMKYIRNNYARLNIYFETLKVDELTDQPKYPLFSLICDFGGSLGLFFGASIVAIFETIDFWLIEGCSKKKSKISTIDTT